MKNELGGGFITHLKLTTFQTAVKRKKRGRRVLRVNIHIHQTVDRRTIIRGPYKKRTFYGRTKQDKNKMDCSNYYSMLENGAEVDQCFLENMHQSNQNLYSVEYEISQTQVQELTNAVKSYCIDNLR